MVQREGADTSGTTGAGAESNRLSRRQVMGRAGAVATAGVAAWVVPEILIAQPGSAAGLSGNPGGNGSADVGASAHVSTPVGAASAAAGASASAASAGPAADTDVAARTRTGAAGDASSAGASATSGTGIAFDRDGEIGSDLASGGWGLRHWSPSRG
jgi:hypothetical protein